MRLNFTTTSPQELEARLNQTVRVGVRSPRPPYPAASPPLQPGGRGSTDGARGDLRPAPAQTPPRDPAKHQRAPPNRAGLQVGLAWEEICRPPERPPECA